MSGGVECTIRWHGDQLKVLAQAMAAFPKQSKTAIVRALNKVGDQSRTQMVRTLTRQTGLKRKTIVKALRRTGANAGTLAYAIRSQGGDISLKYFSPREGKRAGVTARPFGSPHRYPGAFTKGGLFPNRVAFSRPGMQGHVFTRSGSGRGPLTLINSGVIIPQEMTQRATEQAFWSYSARLPEMIMAQLAYLIPGK